MFVSSRTLSFSTRRLPHPSPSHCAGAHFPQLTPVARLSSRFKRTLNILQPNTEEGLAKFQEEIDAIHTAFKAHVLAFRPGLDLDRVATGEAWLAVHARELGLVDGLSTADAYLRSKRTQAAVLHLKPRRVRRTGLAAILERGVEAAARAAEAAAQVAGGVLSAGSLRAAGAVVPGMAGARSGLVSTRVAGGAVSGTERDGGVSG